jgi:hypothetical protein
MKTRATLALAVVAGLPLAATAQESFLVTYTWNEVLAGTITAPGVPNSVVDPGEGARIRLGVTALINGTNAVGQTINYTNPAPGGTGTVKGIGSVVYDLIGTNNADGTWMPAGPGFLGPAAPFTNGQTPGTPQPGGSRINGMGGSQFISPGGTANGANANQQLFRGVWTPGSYANRIVNFMAAGSILVPTGQHNSVLLSYGQGTGIDPTTGEPFNFDNLVGKYFGTNFGQGINIPIAPAPSSLALLGLGALVAGARRRS